MATINWLNGQRIVGLVFLLAVHSAWGQTSSNGVWTFQQLSGIFSSTGNYPTLIPGNFQGTSYTQVKFKSSQEIILSPEPDIGQGFSASAAGGSSWFHAYLVPPISYAELKENMDGSYCVTMDNLLNFRYVERYAAGSLDYTVYNSQHVKVLAGKNIGVPSTVQVDPMLKHLGSNFIQLDLNPNRNIPNLSANSEKESYYLLEVRSDKGDRYMLRFKYIPIYE